MSEKSLREIQAEVGRWSINNFGFQVSKRTGVELGSLAPLMGMGEELGELFHAVLKHHQGIREMALMSAYEEARNDALADILIYMCDFATREDVDLQAVLNKVWLGVVAKRNWVDAPVTGEAASDVQADAL